MDERYPVLWRGIFFLVRPGTFYEKIKFSPISKKPGFALVFFKIIG
jgi:hypothetical protein